MEYRVRINAHAERAIRRLPQEISGQAIKIIEGLSSDPRPLGRKKLKARSEWSIRIADYRVLYLIDDENRIVTITEAKHRRDVYR